MYSYNNTRGPPKRRGYGDVGLFFGETLPPPPAPPPRTCSPAKSLSGLKTQRVSAVIIKEPVAGPFLIGVTDLLITAAARISLLKIALDRCSGRRQFNYRLPNRFTSNTAELPPTKHLVISQNIACDLVSSLATIALYRVRAPACV